MKFVVLSTFDIFPAVDGGQTRYLSLYRELAKRHDVTILAYDIKNSGRRKEYLIDGIRVIACPASEADASKFWYTLERTRKVAHDILCIRDYQFSDEFAEVCAREVPKGDVVVASHPYLAFYSFGLARRGSVKVYESHNVEFDVKKQHLASGLHTPEVERLMRSVFFGEEFACRSADVVTAVSDADAARLRLLYSIDRTIWVVPNGVNCSRYLTFDEAERYAFRERLGAVDSDVGVFLGSGYGPNVESYQRTRLLLQAADFKGVVVIIGSIAQVDRRSWPSVGFREVWLGYVPDELKITALSCSDFALHLVYSGGGTNLKLFDYMAAGCFILSNEFGSRGINGNGWCFVGENDDAFVSAARNKIWRSVDASNVKKTAARLVREAFDWSVAAKSMEEAVGLFSRIPAKSLVESSRS